MNPESTSSQGSKQSFTMDDFAKALEQPKYNYEFQKGQIVTGKVYSYESEGIYVDIGGKSLALLPIQEASLGVTQDLSEALPLKLEREFLIIREQDAEGEVLLSVKQLEINQIWERLTELQEGGQSFQVRVIGTNKGGVTVDVESLRGFIPRSHLLAKDNLESLIDQVLTVNFLELDQEKKKIVMSQRLAAQSAGFSKLLVGQLVEGNVVGVKPFGVFVDLEGLTGLLHITQVSQKRVDSLSTIFAQGNLVKAMIVDLDEGRKRISLSTKVLENYPGEMLEKIDEVMESADARAERARKALTQFE
ncbi:MAG: S1 RNA-binding domain-containing protein [Okeania sp. SIO3I5]|uniref:S1 RNA-binding domain-containing protein n=1 Tax=Okeania sp. SIO3I5 TaxID=2607805 RepID=UPI0013BD0398|nr:S1 RNA-binding domain-containing protein [Okeania sp. SIO3I5]NEQ39436.1 S1 RNA-binding domain-containing protein [Okeania sp. SIO3I5]